VQDTNHESGVRDNSVWRPSQIVRPHDRSVCSSGIDQHGRDEIYNGKMFHDGPDPLVKKYHLERRAVVYFSVL
jgi:hypothetical protein